MSANTAVVPPTSAYVPGGAAAWACGRSPFLTVFTAVVDSGPTDSVTVYSAVAWSVLTVARARRQPSLQDRERDLRLRGAGDAGRRQVERRLEAEGTDRQCHQHQAG